MCRGPGRETDLSEPGSAYRLSVLEERWRSDRSPRVFLQLADELRRAGRAGRAVEVLRDGLRWHPESVSGWVALGRLLLDEGEAAAAIEAFDLALERDPGQVVAAKLLTESWIQIGDADRAASSLERARLLSLPDADLEALVAAIDRLRGDAEEAEAPPPEPEGSTIGAADPFDLRPPTRLPDLDLDGVRSGRRSWRRVERSNEPFAGLLEASPRGERIEAALRRPGIFGWIGTALEPIELPPAEPAPELARAAPEPPPAIEAPKLAAAEPVLELPVAEVLPPLPTVDAPPLIVAPSSADVAPAPTPANDEEIFRTYTIGEEVERETALEPVLEAEPEHGEPQPATTATLAALYLAQGHLDDAEREYRKVLAERAGDAGALAGLEKVALARRAAAAPTAVREFETRTPLAGLTARRIHRLKTLYDQLRARRREGRRHVS